MKVAMLISSALAKSVVVWKGTQWLPGSEACASFQGFNLRLSAKSVLNTV